MVIHQPLNQAKMQQRLGESLASVQKYDASAENITTSSLEALQSYSLGYRAMNLNEDRKAAIPLFQRATEQGPNFAMAYARLANNYSNWANRAWRWKTHPRRTSCGSELASRAFLHRIQIGADPQ